MPQDDVGSIVSQPSAREFPGLSVRLLMKVSAVSRRYAPVRPSSSKRDPRLPTPGTVLSRQWHGREIRVLVREDGFEHGGVLYASASALARAVTGQRWNGKLWLGLTARKR